VYIIHDKFYYNDRFIKAKNDTNGQVVRIELVSACVDSNLEYNGVKDVCMIEKY